MAGGDIAADRLEDVAYLARSGNRFGVLEALRTGARSLGDLREITGASRPTLNRILGDFEDRGWAERTPEGPYEATVRGEHVALELGRYLAAMETVRSLGDGLAILPTEDLWIGLQHFSDATVRTPESYDPAALGRYLAEHLREATSFRWLTYVGPPGALDDAIEEGVRSGRLTAEGVVPDSLLEYYAENPQQDRFGEWYRTEELRPDTEAGITMYRYDGTLPCNLFVLDDTVFIENSQVPDVAPGTVVETRNEVVHTWALDVVDKYIDAADRVDPYWE